jgi:hypothetical protein
MDNTRATNDEDRATSYKVYLVRSNIALKLQESCADIACSYVSTEKSCYCVEQMQMESCCSQWMRPSWSVHISD